MSGDYPPPEACDTDRGVGGGGGFHYLLHCHHCTPHTAAPHTLAGYTGRTLITARRAVRRVPHSRALRALCTRHTRCAPCTAPRAVCTPDMALPRTGPILRTAQCTHSGLGTAHIAPRALHGQARTKEGMEVVAQPLESECGNEATPCDSGGP